MSRTPQEINAEIIGQLDVAAEYAVLGVQASGSPRSSGMVSCHAFGREDRRPSAWFNIKTGYYGDSGSKDGEAYTCSLWDFATKTGKFPDWGVARKAYAEKAGVALGRNKRAARGVADWREKLELQEWSVPGNEVLARVWCVRKPGVTVEAVKAAGGRLAHYPCYVDKKTKELKRTRDCRQVVAIPCYGQWLLDADPVAWTVFDSSGRPFDVTPKNALPTDPRTFAKNLSVGPTAGTLCGLSSLMALCDPDRREKIQIVWKVEGIPDLLAIWAAIPEQQREEVVVVTQAGGATSDVHSHQAKILAGLSVMVVGDLDDAGEVGAEKWAKALHGMASEVRVVKLPGNVEKKHGKDLRDFLTEGE